MVRPLQPDRRNQPDPRKVDKEVTPTPLTLDEQHNLRTAKAWYPHKREGAGQGDTLTGELVALDSVWSDYHEATRVVAVVRDDDGAMWSVRTYPTRLHDEWLRAQPQVGERVSVKFAGMLERKKDGKAYPDFSVAVERDAPAVFDYGRVGAEASDGELPDDVVEDEARGQAQADAQAESNARDADIPF